MGNKSSYTAPMTAEDIRTFVGEFASRCMKSQLVWGLHNSHGWLTCVSQLEDGGIIQAIPFWSSKSAIRIHFSGDEQEYKPTSIPFNEFTSIWAGDLANDHLLIGLDWEDNKPTVTVNISDLEKEFIQQW